VYSGVTMYKEYETKQTPCLLSTCTFPTNNLYVSPNHYWNSELHISEDEVVLLMYVRRIGEVTKKSILTLHETAESRQ